MFRYNAENRCKYFVLAVSSIAVSFHTRWIWDNKTQLFQLGATGTDDGRFKHRPIN